MLSWYTSELEHDQKGFATLTKYSSVVQLPRGNALGPNLEVTANSEQIFIAEAASPEQATEWVLCINDCIQRLRGQASPQRGGGGGNSDMEKKLMEQAMAETRRMEQMQAQHRLRRDQSQAELSVLENEARTAQLNAQTASRAFRWHTTTGLPVCPPARPRMMWYTYIDLWRRPFLQFSYETHRHSLSHCNGNDERIPLRQCALPRT